MGCSGEVSSLDWVQVHGRWSLSFLLRNSAQKQRLQQDSIRLNEKGCKGENASALGSHTNPIALNAGNSLCFSAAAKYPVAHLKWSCGVSPPRMDALGQYDVKALMRAVSSRRDKQDEGKHVASLFLCHMTFRNSVPHLNHCASVLS